MKTSYQSVASFITLDGSVIRELMRPALTHPELTRPGQGRSEKQSLAEAIVSPGQSTKLHRHHRSEELYHVTAGQGLMTLGTDIFDVSEGDTVCIPPGTPHRIENISDTNLKILCCCAPAYTHDDTELLE